MKGWVGRALLGLAILGGSLLLTLIAFGLPLGDSLALLAQGAFGDRFGLARTVVKAVPLLVTGLGIVVAWRGGCYNIGGEGQFVAGGLLGAWAFQLLGPSAPPSLILVSVLASCVVGGALWAGLAGWLQVRRGVDVVISTILLNFVALQLLAWAAHGPLQETRHALPQTEALPQAAMLPRFDPQTDLHAGAILALLVAGGVFLFLFMTRSGFRLRLVGANPMAARANRIDARAVQMQAMLISGGLCGLGGGIEYAANAGRLSEGFAQGWGFLAIPVALLGGLHPLWVILSAVYFAALLAGSEQLSRFTPAGATLVYVIQAIAVLAYVAYRAATGRRPAVRDEAV